MEALRAIFDAQVDSAPDCRRAVVAPVVLELRCGGTDLTVRAGGSGAEDDTITITPLEAGSP